MSGGYADYKRMQSEHASPKNPFRGVDDLSRLILFGILAVIALVGYFYDSHINKPQNVLVKSVEKTLGKSFRMSIEGKTSLQDSTIARYRSRESYYPGRNSKVETMPGAGPAPFGALEIMDLIRNAARSTEMKKEDMYGKPTRHFSGETFRKTPVPGMPAGYYFEYWADMRNLAAVRIMLTGVCRDVAVNARGDSISSETVINVGFY